MKEDRPKQFFDWAIGERAVKDSNQEGLPNHYLDLAEQLLGKRIRDAFPHRPEYEWHFTSFIHQRITGKELDGISFVRELREAFDDWQQSKAIFANGNQAARRFNELAPVLVDALVDHEQVKQQADDVLLRYYKVALAQYLWEVQEDRD
jgi:hypothetical protein